MRRIILHPSAEVHVDLLWNEKRESLVKQKDKGILVPIKECETSYAVELIENILESKGPGYLCDEILRDESLNYVEASLRNDILAYVIIEELDLKTILDFGCGSGAASMVLSRMFPKSEIVGIELEERLINAARLRKTYYKAENIQFIQTLNGKALPENLGTFDCVILSAVYEHLLPSDRKVVLKQIWSLLKPEGILFLNQTPYRYSPVETHTTSGLPFINYFPDSLAKYYAWHFSKRRLKGLSWEELLRAGIRGGSVKEIVNYLGSEERGPILLDPTQEGIKDRIDLWYRRSADVRFSGLQKLSY